MKTQIMIFIMVITGVCSPGWAMPFGPAPQPPGYWPGGIANADFEAGYGPWEWHNAYRFDFSGNYYAFLRSECMVDPITGDCHRSGRSDLSAPIQVPANASYLRFVSYHGVWSYEPSGGGFQVGFGGLGATGDPEPGQFEAFLENGWQARYVAIDPMYRGQTVWLCFSCEYSGYADGSVEWCIDYIGFDPPGWTQVNPIIPDVPQPGRFVFQDVAPGWADPQTAWGFRYVMTSASCFTKIEDFPTGFGPLTVEAEGQTLGAAFGPGDSVDFVALLGHGVTEFTVTEIDPLVDPSDPTGFPLKIRFDTPSASFEMLAIPEPGTLALLAAGGLGVFLRRRRK